MTSDFGEHFTTLFDSHFLLQGITLYRSLEKWVPKFHLWVLCMDVETEQSLSKMRLPHLTLIPLDEVEDERLLKVKPGRSKGEYCWTLTPFLFPVVFKRAPEIARVTYIDADLFFFSNPITLFKEFEKSGKHIQITDHAYDPKYDQTAISGRFCVQFLTFRQTVEAAKVYGWWMERCLEWCFAKTEDGKFGDQKYLDLWPNLFPNEVHILTEIEKTLAPWNLNWFGNASGMSQVEPVLYHFHGLRFFEDQIRLWEHYRIRKEQHWIYDEYMQALTSAYEEMSLADIPLKPFTQKLTWRGRIRKSLERLTRNSFYLPIQCLTKKPTKKS